MMQTIGSFLLIGFAWGAAGVACAGPQTAPSDLEVRLAAAIASPVGSPSPGCAAGVFRNGEVLATAATGLADLEQAAPITADTRFYAASVSKQFTALAVLQQVVGGRIGLDEDVRRVLPELPDYGRPVTVRMLLHHTAGVVDNLNVATLEGELNANEMTRAGALAMVFRQKETRFPPGSRFEYSNGGYLLLSEIVERLSGEPFETYVAAHVLAPANMTRSFMMRDTRGDTVDRATGYRIQGGEPVRSDRYPPFGGSGGLVTTLNDLAAWDHDIDSGHRVWTPEITRLMLGEGRFANGAPVMRRGHSLSYAGGLATGPDWFHHTGQVGGFSNIYARHPGSRTGVALLCNDGAIESTARADAIASLLGQGLSPIGGISANPHPLDGDYRNPSLAATWSVKTEGEALALAIYRPGVDAPAELTLTRMPDGDYRFTGLTLSPDDDNDGFTVTFGLVSYAFERAVR